MNAFKMIEADARIKQICKKAVQFYGFDHQRKKLIEEEGELLTAISNKDPNNQIEEVADVAVLYIQLGFVDDVKRYIIKGYDNVDTMLHVEAIVKVIARYSPPDVTNQNIKDVGKVLVRKIERLDEYMKNNHGWLPGFKPVCAGELDPHSCCQKK
jgi:uncharacterized protein YabN with tetrapyrrole methylase and pyrophosphatase domain